MTECDNIGLTSPGPKYEYTQFIGKDSPMVSFTKAKQYPDIVSNSPGPIYDPPAGIGRHVIEDKVHNEPAYSFPKSERFDQDDDLNGTPGPGAHNPTLYARRASSPKFSFGTAARSLTASPELGETSPDRKRFISKEHSFAEKCGEASPGPAYEYSSQMYLVKPKNPSYSFGLSDRPQSTPPSMFLANL